MAYFNVRIRFGLRFQRWIVSEYRIISDTFNDIAVVPVAIQLYDSAEFTLKY